ncbi:NAD(P)-dependent oxidoreductase [Marinomonas piezotolerans]|uniref:NAD(P)-dependent oxidoreductase n=1 Tax=Marinomonas piezotolerans TaxID=2213058 RepID=A0A370UDX7_9GAMM|nr:SDR family oxidoreductase [Marinomonas piezotolerans]RDL45987.1 NAD(P)-dependent oxidoreductase [Marinomonas piezotolerans]
MNKIAIITGASRGIGAATALTLAKNGYKVCVNYLKNQDAADRICASINSSGGIAIAYQADVSDELAVESLFTFVNQNLGEVTHLVNNVGILFEKTELVNMSAERFTKVLNTNVLSAFLCSKAFVKQNSNYGAIVNVSSAASRSGAPFEYVDYASSKGAMDSFTKGLSLELASRNIRVNSVRPGFILTDIHADGGEPDRVSRLSSQIPLKRGGTAQEVAEAIVWLLSDQASYVTGSFIDIAGGK